MNAEATKKWLVLFTDKVNENKDYLSELDSAIGDGDHGMNMARGTTAVKEALAEKNPTTIVEIFKLVGMTLVSKVGGASGPLYGSAFISMAKEAGSTDDLAAILQAGLDGIEKRGKAVAGEKTMIDTWVPVIEAVKGKQLSQSVIEMAVESTKEMKATKGRASYLGERSIGHLDPGAVSSGYLFETMIEAGVENE